MVWFIGIPVWMVLYMNWRLRTENLEELKRDTTWITFSSFTWPFTILGICIVFTIEKCWNAVSKTSTYIVDRVADKVHDYHYERSERKYQKELDEYNRQKDQI